MVRYQAGEHDEYKAEVFYLDPKLLLGAAGGAVLEDHRAQDDHLDAGLNTRHRDYKDGQNHVQGIDIVLFFYFIPKIKARVLYGVMSVLY